MSWTIVGIVVIVLLLVTLSVVAANISRVMKTADEIYENASNLLKDMDDLGSELLDIRFQIAELSSCLDESNCPEVEDDTGDDSDLEFEKKFNVNPDGKVDFDIE